MTHAEKLRRMELDMRALGIPRASYAPAAYRVLWRMRLELPPPLFTAFVPLAFVLGLAFALLWAPLTWLLLRLVQALLPGAVSGAPFLFVAYTALGAGALFGVTMAGLVRYQARRLSLPLWPGYAGLAAPGDRQ